MPYCWRLKVRQPGSKQASLPRRRSWGSSYSALWASAWEARWTPMIIRVIFSLKLFGRLYGYYQCQGLETYGSRHSTWKIDRPAILWRIDLRPALNGGVCFNFTLLKVKRQTFKKVYGPVPHHVIPHYGNNALTPHMVKNRNHMF